MLKIAVCDDNAAELEQTTAHLQAFFAQRPELVFSLTQFGNGRKLLDALEQGENFDLYVLDVLMPELNGIQAGKAIRRLGRNGAIVYLTTSPDYAVDSYQTQAFFYLLKPVERKKLFEVLDRVVDTFRQRESQSIIVHTAAALRSVPLNDILYLERVDRVVRYCLVSGERLDSRTIRGSLREEAAPLLADGRFAQCGASFVLGLHHIRSVEKNEALLDNGQRLPVPKNVFVDLKQAWMNYWLGGGRKA